MGAFMILTAGLGFSEKRNFVPPPPGGNRAFLFASCMLDIVKYKGLTGKYSVSCQAE
jgi:hypothetical protein